MRRRNAADVWSIRQCLYARYIHRTQVRLPGIFAGNVALLTGLRLINRAYRKGTCPLLQAPSIQDEWVGLLTFLTISDYCFFCFREEFFRFFFTVSRPVFIPGREVSDNCSISSFYHI